ncbi:MAG: hypothetical protein ACRDIY_08155 [Chloroflexota bacterium]
MKVALATHSLCGYPVRLGQVPAPEKRRALFTWAKRHGFAGIEVGD